MAAREKSRLTKLYDVTVKQLVEARPLDLLPLAEIGPNARVRSIDADLATVLPEADKVLEVTQGGKKYILHFEFQTGHDRALLQRLLSYNVLLYRRHGRPVWSVLILLTPDADHRDLDGELRIALPDGRPCHRFHYRVVRLWELRLASILAGPIGALPFAPLSAEGGSDLPGLVDKMKLRLDRETDAGLKDLVWSCAYFLTGLRYPPSVVAPFFEGVRAMAESSTFLATLAGQSRKILLRQGRERFGPASPGTIAALQAIEDPDDLEDLCVRVLRVSSWEELLPKPAPRRANGKRKK